MAKMSNKRYREMTQMDLFKPNQEYLDVDKMQKDLRKHNQKLKENAKKRKRNRF